MFERYTEKARRVIFFARYEASQVGSPEIGDEHLLIGLMREDKGLLRRYIGGEPNAESIRAAITASTVVREPSSTSVDLPLTREAQRILAYAAQEAERLAHQHIGTEHLLLGILREESCLSARLLRERGLTIEGTRVAVVEAAKGAEADATQRFDFRGTARNLGKHIRLIEVGSSEPLLTHYASEPLPRIGETIAIHEEGQASRRYRIKDVVWNISHGESGPHMADVELRIVAEDSNGADL